MSYYQNPTDAEFQGNLLLSDRQFTMTFKVKGNSPNSSTLFQAWNSAPYNVSSNKTLTINYSFDAGNTWTLLTIDVSTTAVSTTAATAHEIVGALNGNATFQALFTASVSLDNKGNTYPVIKSLRAREKFKAYVTNSGAEIALRFNKKAGVAEFPTYFDRHAIVNKSSFPDSLGMLIKLDPTSATGTVVDQQIIQQAGFTHTAAVVTTTATISNTEPFQVNDTVTIFDGTTSLDTFITVVTPGVSLTLNDSWGGAAKVQLVILHADYQLLRGRSGIFNFQKINVSGSPDRIDQIIEYPAGALPGDLARKINYVYTGSNTHPNQITEVPYTLTASDLVTP